jgi:photosystem II stability/assembly factor-like uncharacterized protein
MRILLSILLATVLTAGSVAAATSAPAVVSAFAVSPSGSVLLAGTADGLFRSSDGGKSWKQVMSGGEDFAVASVAFDPSAPSDVYVATSLGLFRSTDLGSTWGDKDLLGGSKPGEIAFDPARKGTLYAATADGLYASSDRGASWKGINPNGHTFSVRSLAVRPKPFTLYVINEEGLFASTDRGVSWRPLTDERDDLSAVEFAPPATLHVAANGAHYLRSDDDGNSWEVAKWPHFSDFFLAGDAVYAAAKDAMWRSTDGGKTWASWKSAEELPVRSLVSDPKKAGVLWGAALRDGILISTDGGTTWSECHLPAPSAQLQARAGD